MNVTFFTGSEFHLSSCISQSAVACHTVSRLRAALNIDGEKSKDLHHTFKKKFMQLDTRG